MSDIDTITKEDMILHCLENEENVNLWKLRGLGLSEGGFMNNALRRRIWPLLVGVDFTNNSSKQIDSSIKKEEEVVDEFVSCNNHSEYPNQEDIDQVDRDVARCSWHLLTGSQRAKRRKLSNQNISKVEISLRTKQQRLGLLIKKVLKNGGGELRYYQGFHDVACIFLTVLCKEQPSSGPSSNTVSSNNKDNVDLAAKVLLEVSKSHLKDAMGQDFSSLVSMMRLCLFPLLHAFDTQLHAHLLESEIEPFFAISWLITWFSHDIRDTALVVRIFDAIVCAHPLFPLYLCVAMILHPVNRVELLFAECEFSSLHSILSSLPKNSCTLPSDESDATERSFCVEEDADTESMCAASTITSVSSNPVPIEELIARAISYMKHIPPSKLPALARQYPYESFDKILQDSSSIASLQPPLHWLLTSQWSILRRVKHRKRILLYQKRQSSKSLVHSTTNAFIASGFPPKRRIRTKTVVRFIIFPLFIAALAFAWRPNQFSLLQSILSSKPSCTTPDHNIADSPTSDVDLQIKSDTNNPKDRESFPQNVVSSDSTPRFEPIYLTRDQSSSHCSVLENLEPPETTTTPLSRITNEKEIIAPDPPKLQQPSLTKTNDGVTLTKIISATLTLILTVTLTVTLTTTLTIALIAIPIVTLAVILTLILAVTLAVTLIIILH